MPSARVLDYLGGGAAADRPVSLDLATGAIGFYYADDTSVLYVWFDGAWSTIQGGGGGGGMVPDGNYGDITVSGGGTVWTVHDDVLQSLIDVLLAAQNDWTNRQDFNGGANITPEAAIAINAIGYLGIPQNIALDSGNVTATMGDAGKHFYHSDGNARTLTVPANGAVSYPVGTVLSGINENGAGIVTLAITTDTLRWGNLTGSRSIAANGSWSAIKVSATVWRLTGDGIS